MTSEKTIVAAIRRYLEDIGAKTYKTHGGPFSHAGAPDILGCLNGRALALEVKRPGAAVTQLQAVELRSWERAGAIAGRVESVQDVKNLLEKLAGPYPPRFP
jgi:hypothetical protein